MNLINMKKHLLSLLVVFVFSFSTNAQKIKAHKEKIKNLKISYLTTQLNLTSSEAEKFWPVYNKHYSDTYKLMSKKTEAIRTELSIAKTIDSIDEGKALELFNLMQSIERKKFKQFQKYYTNLKTILPIKKIVKLQLAEKEFSRKLMRKYRHKSSRNK